MAERLEMNIQGVQSKPKTESPIRRYPPDTLPPETLASWQNRDHLRPPF
jgi:hypothetical protein